MRRCLYCYQLLISEEQDFHSTCSRNIFGHLIPPVLPYEKDDIVELGLETVRNQVTVTGVQPKLSLTTAKKTKDGVARFTIVGLWGEYILKPPSDQFRELPELEDLTMHLAQLARIKTVPHTLIRMASGELAYLTRRIDREKGERLAMEDMCQLTERLTEHKYQGSHEQIAKAIQRYSANPGLDIVGFYEQVVFAFLTGNSDMHLKNFSLIKTLRIGWGLAPAYDMVASKLVLPEDQEEMALALNGKKNKLKRGDFEAAMVKARIPEKAQERIFHRMAKAMPGWEVMIENSFLSVKTKAAYANLLKERADRLLI